MLELLPLHADPRALDRGGIEIRARSTEPAEKDVGADGAADVDDQLRLGARYAELRAPDERRADAEGVAQQIERGLVDLDQPLPARLEQALEVRRVGAEESRRAVGVAQRGEV